MTLQLEIVGVLLILLALMHIFIPRRFKWAQELTSLSLITKQILYVHTFFIGFMLLLMGMLCVGSPAELLHTGLGKKICLGLFFFWFTRLIFQFAVYSPELWRGKKFETGMHILFSALWAYFTGVFLFGFFK
jgi:hypothetical protein